MRRELLLLLPILDCDITFHEDMIAFLSESKISSHPFETEPREFWDG